MIWRDLIRGAILGFVLPMSILLTALVLPQEENLVAESTTVSTTQPSQVTTDSTSPEQPTAPSTLVIRVRMQDGELEMELERYVIGVVLSEMPGSFSIEALKAQCVAARTYGLRICQEGRHGGAVCTDYSCCQGYCPPEEYSSSREDLSRIIAAAQATEGQVLTYDGVLICATYFSCSGGSTEDAVAVWGTDVPYLQAVESPGEEFADVFSYQIILTAEAFENALCISLPGDPDHWFGPVSYTAGGGVEWMEIGGVSYRGTTLRSLLGLRSTVFSIAVMDNMIVIEVLGFGHRVGMSQYGAEAMALNGSDYRAILSHYYIGTTLEVYAPKP